MNNKRNFIISTGLILLSIIFTILLKCIDVRAVGVNNTNIGFSSINQFFHRIIGVNMIFYYITDWLGFIPIILALSYAIIGLVQLIKRKSLLKVDKELMILGGFYVALVVVYIFFEKVIINYRPTLIDGVLEASYPSSHTLLSICLCGSAIIVNRKLFNNKLAKITNILVIIIGSFIVIGRVISGVHWFTDIIGGIIISASLLMTLYSFVNIIKKEDDKKEENTLQD